jgi:hypothetical protein
MDDEICLRNHTARKARLKRKLILQHKKRMAKLKEEKAAIHKAIMSKGPYTPASSMSTIKNTPLGDITSSILNQNINTPKCSDTNNFSKEDVVQETIHIRRVRTRDYQVNLTKKFEAVKCNTYSSPDFNQNGNINLTNKLPASKKASGSRVQKAKITPRSSFQSQNCSGQFTNIINNSSGQHHRNQQTTDDKNGTDTNAKNTEKYKICEQRRLNANNFKVNLVNQFEAVNCNTQPTPELSHVGSSSKVQVQFNNTNTADEGVSQILQTSFTKRKQTDVLPGDPLLSTEISSSSDEDHSHDSGTDTYVSDSGSENDDLDFGTTDPSSMLLQGKIKQRIYEHLFWSFYSIDLNQY